MEHELLGNPLDALHAAYVDLTTKIEAKAIDLDAALLQIQSTEVVDAAGHSWRIDPVTQSFVRRAPGADTPWKHADPSEYVRQAPQGPVELRRQQVVSPPADAVPHAPGGSATKPDGDARPKTRGRRTRWWMYAIGGVTGLAVGVAAIVVVAQATRSTPGPAPTRATAGTSASGSPRPSTSARQGVLPGAYPVPSSTEYNAVLTEFTSGNLNRIHDVAETSQYNISNQRLYAATYAGWLAFGLTIRTGRPMGGPSGLTATQVWELLSQDDVLAAATVNWHRADRASPWRLAKWPLFRPIS